MNYSVESCIWDNNLHVRQNLRGDVDVVYLFCQRVMVLNGNSGWLTDY